jgi:hypothetical protein
MNELKNRGVGDVLIAVVDGLKGFPDAISAVFPQAVVQTCIVGSLKNPVWTDSLRQIGHLRFGEGRCSGTRNAISWSCSSRDR